VEVVLEAVVAVVLAPPVPLAAAVASTTTLPPQPKGRRNEETRKRRIEARIGRPCREAEAWAKTSAPRPSMNATRWSG
jgi:hypothetical protein